APADPRALAVGSRLVLHGEKVIIPHHKFASSNLSSFWESHQPMTDTILCAALAAAAIGLLLAVYFARWVLAHPQGNAKMIEISAAIRAGSMAYLRRQYVSMGAFVVVMAILITFLLDWGRPYGALAYVFGATVSALAGFVGMRVATA